MKHTKSYKFNPDRIKSVNNIFDVAGEHERYWNDRAIFMLDGSVHKFIAMDFDWFEYNDLDDILRVICNDLKVLEEFVSSDAIIEE